MTTIVYRDGILAADRACSQGSRFEGSVRKVWRRRDGHLIGGCGRYSIICRYVEWFLGGERGRAPSLGEQDNDADMLIVRPSGLVLFHDSCGAMTVKAPFYAMGSGVDFAYGAMEMGATARQAVRIASRRDNNSGGGVNWVSL